MSLQPGGISDKLGNKYENLYLARLFLELIRGRYVSITVEALDEEGKCAEYVCTKPNGERHFFQCKATNGSENYWRPSDLNSLNIYKNALKVVTGSENNTYRFISPLPYNELDELCNRARKYSSKDVFINNQLSNPKLKSAFCKALKYFELDENKDKDFNVAISVLSRIYFEKYSFDGSAYEDLLDGAANLFYGNSENCITHLANYATSKEKFGIIINSRELIDYLSEIGITFRDSLFDDSIISKVNTINNRFIDSYNAINGSIIHRTEADDIYNSLMKNESVLVLGKAGYGKSGCIQEVINKLSDEHIEHLCIKLDKNEPVTSAEKFGEALDLSQSPVYTLNKLSGGKPCVLILDQMDALRWSSLRHSTAIDVCKEMIRQTKSINKNSDGNISLIFVCRTSDYENHDGLRSLIDEDDADIVWKTVAVDTLSEQDLSQLVPDYKKLTIELQKLLNIPSNLYIWLRLDVKRRNNYIVSANDLMNSWWEQIIGCFAEIGIKDAELENCKNAIVSYMDENDAFYVPQIFLTEYKHIIDALISNGVLIDEGRKLSFAHQSFLDYFLINDSLRKVIIDQNTIFDLIGDFNSQMPNNRYRLLVILQNVIDIDESIFLTISDMLINSESVRYYYKCAVFEIVGQCSAPSDTLLEYAYKYFQDMTWHDFLYKSVYYSHCGFIISLAKYSSIDWMEEKYLNLLRSINNINPDFVVECLRPYSLNDYKTDERILNNLCYDFAYDSEMMFSLRSDILNKSPCLLHTQRGIYIAFRKNNKYLIPMLNLFICNFSKENIIKVYFPEQRDYINYVKANFEAIIDGLFDNLNNSAKVFEPSIYKHISDKGFLAFTNEKYNDSAIRKIVDFVKCAIKEYAIEKPAELICYIGSKTNLSFIGVELALEAFKSMSTDYSDSIIKWLLHDFDANIFDYSSCPEDYLKAAKSLIKKHTQFCSSELFNELETNVVNWSYNSEYMIKLFKLRQQLTKEYGQPVYYAFWGCLQKELLPCFCELRLSKSSKELLSVLNRNDNIKNSSFNCGFFAGEGGTVASPIDDKINRIGEKTWLQIISTPDSEFYNHHFKYENGRYIEAAPRFFADSLFKAVKNDQNRYAAFALKIPTDCYSGYISSILSGISEKNENGAYLNIESTENVLRHFINRHDAYVLSCFCKIIENRPKENWSEDIIKHIIQIATEEIVPIYSEDYEDEENYETCNSERLQSKALNSPQGNAVRALTAVLFEKEEYCEAFKKVVVSILNYGSFYVKFQLIDLLVPFIRYDKSFAISSFLELIKDARMIYHHRAWDLILNSYKGNENYLNKQLIIAFNGDDTELSKNAAEYICALSIFKENDFLINLILSNHYDDGRADVISRQAVSSLGSQEYHEKSMLIISDTIKKCPHVISNLHGIISKNKVDLEFDYDFICELLSSSEAQPLATEFLDKVEPSNDHKIEKQAKILEIIGNSIDIYRINVWDYENFSNSIVKCVFALLGKSNKNESVVSICLNALDKLYFHSYGSAQNVSKLITDLSN